MRTFGILASAAALSPCLFYSLVSAASFAPLPVVPARPHAAAPLPVVPARPAPETIDLGERRLRAGRYEAPTTRGRTVALTLDPRLQAAAEEMLAANDAPLGAIVVMGVDGRLLAVAGRSAAGGDRPDLALDPWAPSASVFKVVTAAALIDAGVRPETEVCVHGGAGDLGPEQLVDDPRKDAVCASLAAGLARSTNAVLGKLAARRLEPSVLRRYAAAFGYDRPLPFGRPSTAAIPSEPLELARTAAGFWHTDLSAVGGALVAATVASGGLALTPYLTDAERQPPERVLRPETARAVARMLAGTTGFGTARSAFHAPDGTPYLRVAVAGKTGTLSRPPVAGLPPLGYSWFVGFAPADRPSMVVSVLLGTSPGRPTRAATLARALLARDFGRAVGRRQAW